MHHKNWAAAPNLVTVFAQPRILAEKTEANVVVLHNVPEGSNLKHHFDPRFRVGIKIHHFRHSNAPSIPLECTTFTPPGAHPLQGR